MQLSKQRRLNIAASFLVLVCAAVYFKVCVLAPVGQMPVRRDFVNYWNVGKAVLSGQSPYSDSSWFYPPLTAFLLVPFGFTDYLTARWIWFLLSQVFLLTAAWLLWRAAGRDRIALCSVCCVWALCGGAGESLEGGQIGPLLVLLFAAAYTTQGWTQGFTIGAGFVLKYIPGIAILPVILNRGWRALTAFGATAALGLLIPWAVLRLFFPGPYTPLKPTYWMGTPHVWSWSVPSLVLRILDPPTRGSRLPYNWDYGNIVDNLRLPRSHELISAATGAIVLLAGIISLVIVCQAKLNREQVSWAMVSLVSLSLAATPVCWTHYQVLQYPGIALLLADSIRRRAWYFTAAIVVCAALLYPLPFAVLTSYVHRYGFTAASPATLYIWTSAAPLACLILFVLALRRCYCTRAVLM